MYLLIQFNSCFFVHDLFRKHGLISKHLEMFLLHGEFSSFSDQIKQNKNI